jgi:2-amino-4-hydroxy-6-hydroxymethyldihydropteridine diphosphokinase
VFLGLGSNLGDRAANLRAALRALRDVVELRAVSRVYETEPVGNPDQPDFWNLVVEVDTKLDAVSLLAALKGIERALGRVPAFRNAPRTIDIDILAYGPLVVKTRELEIPHPRLHERTFVLYPLAEVAPDFRHPASGKSISEMMAALAAPSRAVPLAAEILEEDE